MHNNQVRSNRKFVRLFTNTDKSLDTISMFIKEFGYQEMFHECLENKKALVIREATVEIIYELESFSRQHDKETFFIEYFNRNFISKTVSIINGEVVESKENEKNHKENKTQPKKNLPKPKTKNKTKENNHSSLKPNQNKPRTRNHLSTRKNDNFNNVEKNNEKKTITIEDNTEKKKIKTLSIERKSNVA